MPPDLENLSEDLGQRAEQVAALLGDDDGAGDATIQDSPRGDAAPEAPVSGNDEGTPEPAPEPAIAPPLSWSADDKAHFQALPPATQKIIAERESERERGVSQKLSEAAAERKAAEAEKQAAAQERQRFVSHAAQFVDAKVQAFQSEFADVVKGEITPLQLQEKDPMRFLRLQAMQGEIALAENTRQQAQLTLQREHEARLADIRKSERQKFVEKFPEFRDEVKLKALDKDLGEYARNVVGLSPEEYAGLTDSRALTALHKARLYDNLVAEQKAAVDKKVVQMPTRTVRPGAQANGDASERVKALKQRANQTGRLDDRAAVVLEAIKDL